MNEVELFAGIRDANYHEGGIRCLSLFRVEEIFFGALRADVERLCRNEAGSKVSDPAHVTHWTGPRGSVVQFSLLNRSGRYDDFHSDHDLSCFGKRFHGAAKYPALSRLVNVLPCVTNFRINVMGSHGKLSPHEEHSVIRTASGSVGLRIRLHLPVATNRGAEIVLDGAVYHLELGVVYFVNHGCVHSARNSGEHDRIHLVWDMLLTQEAFAFLFGTAPAGELLRNIYEADRDPAPLRMEKMGAYARIQPHVKREDANQVGWCEMQ